MLLEKVRVCGDADTRGSGLRPEDLLRANPLGLDAGRQQLRVVQQVAEFFEPIGGGRALRLFERCLLYTSRCV